MMTDVGIEDKVTLEEVQRLVIDKDEKRIKGYDAIERAVITNERDDYGRVKRVPIEQLRKYLANRKP